MPQRDAGIPTVPRCCLDLDFSNSHFDRLINFVDTETSGGQEYLPALTPASATSVCCCSNVPHPASVASLIRQHSLAIVLCRAAWVGLLPLAIPFLLLPRPLTLFFPFSLFLSLSLSVCLANWSLGFCVWKEALWFLICLSAFARWILSIMWSPSLGLSLCLPLPLSISLSLYLALCALQFGGFLQSAIVLIVCLKLA